MNSNTHFTQDMQEAETVTYLYSAKHGGGGM